MGSSAVFIVVVTQNFVNNFRNGDEFVTAQYAFMCESARRPVIIVRRDVTDLVEPGFHALLLCGKEEFFGAVFSNYAKEAF